MTIPEALEKIGNPPAATLVARCVVNFSPIPFPNHPATPGDFGMFRAGVTASCVVTRLDAGLCATKAGEWSAGFISSCNSLVGLHPMAPHGNLHYG